MRWQTFARSGYELLMRAALLIAARRLHRRRGPTLPEAPRLVDEVRMDRYDVRGRQNVVESSHAVGRVGATTYDGVEHRVAGRIESAQVGQVPASEQMAARTKAVVKYFPGVDLGNVGRTDRRGCQRRIDGERRQGRRRTRIPG